MPNKEMQYILTYSAMYCNNWEHAELLLRNTPYTRSDWLQKRKELINSPDDSTAPEWANYKAQDSTGEWYWYEECPKPYEIIDEFDEFGEFVGFVAISGNVEYAGSGKIPSGYLWKTSLVGVYDKDTKSQESYETQESYQEAEECAESAESYEGAQEMLNTERVVLPEIQEHSEYEESPERNLFEDIYDLTNLIDSTESSEAKSLLLDTLGDLLIILTGKHL